VKDTFGMTDEDFRRPASTGNEPIRWEIPVRIRPEKIDAIRGIVGPENVATDDYARVKYATGKTMEEAIKLCSGVVEGGRGRGGPPATAPQSQDRQHSWAMPPVLLNRRSLH
jgi:hypothetical protein